MPADTTFSFREVRDLGDVLNATFRFIRQEFVPLAKSLLFIVGPFLALSNTAGALLQTNSILFNPEAGVDSLALFGIEFLVAMLFSLIGGVLAVTVGFGYVVLYQDRGPQGFAVGDVWRLTRQHFFRMLGTVLFFVLIVSAVYLLGWVPAAIVGFWVAAALGDVAGTIVLGLVLLATSFVLFLALPYFMVALSLIFPMRMREPVGLFAATRRAFRLVRGHWWMTFGVLFVTSLIVSVLGLLFNVPTIVLLVLYAATTAEGGSGMLYEVLLAVTGFVGGLAATVLYAIPLVALALQYFNLVERKERTGLMERVETVRRAAEMPAADAGHEAPASTPREDAADA